MVKRVIGPDEWDNRLASAKIAKDDMNKLVMNFLITEGYLEAAKVFEQESGTSSGVNLDSITDRMQVRQALQAGDVEAAVDKVQAMEPQILAGQPELVFHLHQQRLIELIRGNRTQEALAFAAEHLAPACEKQPALLDELERTITLLAFAAPNTSPLAHLLEAAQRQKTASELNAAILTSQSQERESRLPQLLRLLLWAQSQLDTKAHYPRVTDLASARLEMPAKLD